MSFLVTAKPHVVETLVSETLRIRRFFEAAAARRSILVTRDLEFGNPNLFPLERIPGLVILRVPSFFTATQMMKVLREILPTRPLDRLQGYVTVVEIGRIRQRPLR